MGVAPDDVVEERPGEYSMVGTATAGRVAAVAAWLDEHDLPLADLRAGGGSLEDAYLEAMKEVGGRGAPGSGEDDGGAGGAPTP